MTPFWIGFHCLRDQFSKTFLDNPRIKWLKTVSPFAIIPGCLPYSIGSPCEARTLFTQNFWALFVVLMEIHQLKIVLFYRFGLSHPWCRSQVAWPWLWDHSITGPENCFRETKIEYILVQLAWIWPIRSYLRYLLTLLGSPHMCNYSHLDYTDSSS